MHRCTVVGSRANVGQNLKFLPGIAEFDLVFFRMTFRIFGSFIFSSSSMVFYFHSVTTSIIEILAAFAPQCAARSQQRHIRKPVEL